MIRTNDTSTPEVPTSYVHGSFDLVNDFSSLFILSKGKPLRINVFLILLLSGDIETNPGPRSTLSNKMICDLCSRTIARNTNPVVCSDCRGLFHRSCAGITVTFHKKILQNEKSWVCHSCYVYALPFPNDDINIETFDDEEVVIPLDLNDDLVLTDKSCLNIGHLNINGLRSKIDFLRIFLRQHKFDILCLNETKIDSTVPDSEISVPGYAIYRQD